MADMDELSFETDDVVAAESGTDSIFHSVSHIVSFVEGRFKRAEDARLGDEERWMRAYRNYRGLYGPDVRLRPAKSLVYSSRLLRLRRLLHTARSLMCCSVTTSSP